MIVDASVAFKWIAEEEGSDLALALTSAGALSAPSLMLAEVANALWKKARREQIDPSLTFGEEIAGLATIVKIHDAAAFVPAALAIARELGHPVYDCIYLAMTDAEDNRLVTADHRLARAVRSTRWESRVELLA